MKKFISWVIFILIVIESIVLIYINMNKPVQEVLEPVNSTGCYIATRGSDDSTGFYCDYVGDGFRQTLKYDQKTWESLRKNPENVYAVKEGPSPATNTWLSLLASFFILACYKFYKRNKNK